MSEINLITINTRGLRTPEKAQLFATEFMTYNVAIAYLIDTHLNEKAERYLSNLMPNYKIYSNLVPLNRGVSICFQKKLGIEVLDIVKDTVGDFIALKINYGGKKIILAAFYGPSVYNGDCINKI